MTPVRLFLLTMIAMIAFGGNSILVRIGLVDGDIGAGSFALIRLVSGAGLLLLLQGPKQVRQSGDWPAAIALFIYAVFFSYAYISMDAGVGALLLFAVVQIVMVGTGLWRGETMKPRQWTGLMIAFGSLVWWLFPGTESPPIASAAAMIVAGAGWACYSLLGLKGKEPVAKTAGNFFRAAAIAIIVIPIFFFYQPEPWPGQIGVTLAILSGAITSALGYVIWYKTLPHLTATSAGISQLTVPVIAAIGGISFLNEMVSLKFGLVTILILGGVGLATLKPNKEMKEQI